MMREKKSAEGSNVCSGGEKNQVRRASTDEGKRDKVQKRWIIWENGKGVLERNKKK